MPQGEIPRLLNQELKERKPPKQSVEPHHSMVLSSSSKEFGSKSSFDLAPLNPAVPNRGKRKDEHLNSPPPPPAFAQGLVPMPNGDVLHPFCQQNYMRDDLWLEQDGAAQVVVVAKRREKDEQATNTDRTTVREVCTFFMRMKLNTRLFQQKVDWRNPSMRLRAVLDKAFRATAASATVTPARNGSKR